MAAATLMELVDVLLLDYLPFSRVVGTFARHAAPDRSITPAAFEAALLELGEVARQVAGRLFPAGSADVDGAAMRGRLVELAPRCYAVFDVDGDGTVDGRELAAGLVGVCGGEPLDKAKTLFRLYDSDGSGGITKEEMASLLKVVIASQRALAEPADAAADPLPPVDDVAAATTDACFKDADTNGDGALSLDEFVTWYLGSSASAVLD